MKPLLKSIILLLIVNISNGFTCVFAQQTELYGMSSIGGSYGAGSIFKADGDGKNLQNVYSFFSFDGAHPQSIFCKADDDKFYGTTFNGGASDCGILFQWDPSTNLYIKKVEFNKIEDGLHPRTLIHANNGKFYGMTASGGTNNCGVLFEWNPGTNSYVKKIDIDISSIADFQGASIMQATNGKIYGTIVSMNSNLLFEWDIETNNFIKKFIFNNEKDGFTPSGPLIQADNGKLYGLASGGEYGYGVIFEWDFASDTYIKKLDFNGSNGSLPSGSLMQANNGKLYGTTYYGGANNAGIIFEWEPSTNIIVKKAEFLSEEIGSHPIGTMVQVDNERLYGISEGNSIFEFNLISNKLTKKHGFDNNLEPSAGSNPVGSLILANGKLYGMTKNGGGYTNFYGDSGSGVIYEFDPHTGTYTQKINFGKAENGRNPSGHLTLARNGKLYGLTECGGKYDYGVLFELDPSTGICSKKFDFNYTDGVNPVGSLVLAANNKLYGLTNKGGSNIGGVLFEWDPATNSFCKRIEFNELDGYPVSSLVEAYNGKLYGITSVLFEWDPVSNNYTQKYHFSNRAYGSGPDATLMKANNGCLYGIHFRYSDRGSYGEIFEWDPHANIFTSKATHFSGPPYCILAEGKNEKFYGISSYGYGSNLGQLFEWDPVSNTIIEKVAFYNWYPRGSLFQASNGKFYGGTDYAIRGDVGAMFEWDPVTNIFARITVPGEEYNLGFGPNSSIIEVNTIDTSSKVDLLRGLIAYYPFNGNANDESGNGHNGTHNGGTLVQNRFGTPNGAYNFTGEDNTLSFSGFQLNDPVMTVCSWIKISDENTDTVFFSESSMLKIVLRIVNLHYQVELSVGEKQLILGDNNGVFEIDFENPRFDLLMLSYDGSQIKFTINDELISYKKIDGKILTPLFPLIMRNNISYSFNGVVDEIRIYNRLISDMESHCLMDDKNMTMPTIKTVSITDIGKNTASIHGTIKFEEDKDLFKFGVCWGTSPNPDTSNYKLLDYMVFNDTATQIDLSGLIPNKAYYVRMILIKESGIIYYNVLKFSTSPDINYGLVTDVEGNVYKTVNIGGKTWMAENLRTTKYNDGTDIPNITDNIEWGGLTYGAYCWYNNDMPANKNTFGALYNYLAVTSDNKLCPTGWRMPTSEEWENLPCNLESPLFCFGPCPELKEVGSEHWKMYANGTNETGFTALPGGVRQGLICQWNYKDPYPLGEFKAKGTYAFFWKSDGDFFELSYCRDVGYQEWCYYPSLKDGHSVRCINDDENLQISSETSLVTETSETFQKTIEMYPNPANTILYFRNLPKDVSISIFDLNGREIRSLKLTEDHIDISDLAFGLYNVRIEFDNKTLVKKFVKQ